MIEPLPEDDWAPWSPAELSRRLRGVTVPWYVVGGWALDLWHGRQTRAHDDLEFAVLPQGVGACRAALAELTFFVARAGTLAHAPDAIAPDVTQLWGADLDAGRWRVDMMLERGTVERWVYKRDPSVWMPRKQAVRMDGAGLPYLAPTLVLLFKAKQRRPKDERDFEAALPALEPTERRALRRWLAQLHPGHAWIARL